MEPALQERRGTLSCEEPVNIAYRSNIHFTCIHYIRFVLHNLDKMGTVY